MRLTIANPNEFLLYVFYLFFLFLQSFHKKPMGLPINEWREAYNKITKYNNLMSWQKFGPFFLQLLHTKVGSRRIF